MSEETFNPKIVTLCGSTKFEKEFHKINELLTLRNYLVISLGVFGKSLPVERLNILVTKYKTNLDRMHRKKIALSDIVFIMDVNGYIGSSTKDELIYATSLNKEIWYYSSFDIQCKTCGFEWCECSI